jgi:hypothetical protein
MYLRLDIRSVKCKSVVLLGGYRIVVCVEDVFHAHGPTYRLLLFSVSFLETIHCVEEAEEDYIIFVGDELHYVLLVQHVE